MSETTITRPTMADLLLMPQTMLASLVALHTDLKKRCKAAQNEFEQANELRRRKESEARYYSDTASSVQLVIDCLRAELAGNAEDKAEDEYGQEETTF